MEKLPYAISGFWNKKKEEPPYISIAQYKRWLFPACREASCRVQRITEIDQRIMGRQCSSNYHVIDIDAYENYEEKKCSVLCNIHYPYIAFLDFRNEHFMPQGFIDLPVLTKELRRYYPEIVVLAAEELDAPPSEQILDRQCEYVKREIERWGKSLGEIIFNDSY